MFYNEFILYENWNLDVNLMVGILVLAYPVQFSNAPIMVRDFIRHYSELWKGKKVLCVATMGLFSGDGRAAQHDC